MGREWEAEYTHTHTQAVHMLSSAFPREGLVLQPQSQILLKAGWRQGNGCVFLWGTFIESLVLIKAGRSSKS